MKFKSEVQLEALNNAGTDTDKFLVSKADGTVSFRTGAEVLSDIGGASSTYGIKRGIAASAVPDVYTATINGVSSYIDGDAYLIRFTSGNTTGCTLNINNIGSRTLYRNNDGPLIGGDIQDGGEMLCVYNLALLAFQCIGTSPNDIIAYITNADTVTITKGQAVYASGGVGDRMAVKLANNLGDATSAQTVGLVLSTSIAAGQKGFIMMQGLLSNLSTLSTFADGDSVYLGTTAGSITNVKQYAPNHLVYLGFVTTASPGNAGRMYVRVQNGYELDELHNVQAQTPANKDTLYYDNTVTPKQWKTSSISGILGYTPADDGAVVHRVGDEYIDGVKTFAKDLIVNGLTFGIGGNLASTGINNLAIGTNALDINNANNNTAIGNQSLTINTDGFQNVAIGTESLWKNVIGNYNTAIGYQSLRQNTSNNNTAIGTGALRNNTVGFQNTAIGTEALLNNIGGQECIAIGKDALRSNIDANWNTAIGNSALQNNTTGYQNTAFGRFACLSNISGNYNMAIGVDALRANTISNYNTAIGHKAGYTVIGFQNTFIGGQDDAVVSDQDPDVNNSIAIGYNAYTSKNNQVVLGSDLITETLLRGNIVINAPTTSTSGTYSFLTINSTTSVIEKLPTTSLNFLPLSGGDMTGNINWVAQNANGLNWSNDTDTASIKFYSTGDADANTRLEFNISDNNTEYFRWTSTPSPSNVLYEVMRLAPTALGSGNAILTVSGKVIANSLATPTGLGTEFLKANGTVDSNTYALDSNVVRLTGNQTITGTKTFNGDALGNIVTNNSTDSSSIYCNLTGTGDAITILNSLNGKAIQISNTYNGTGGYGVVVSNNLNCQNRPYTYFYAGNLKYYVDYLGNVEANSFVKTGGLSTEYLMANGTTTTSTSAALSAYKLVANNTASSAVPTEFTFRKWDSTTYSGAITWTPSGTPPNTILAQSYSGQQVGNMVSLNLSISYANAGTSNTQVIFALPSDFPTPLSPTGFTTGFDIIANGTGWIASTTSNTATTGAKNCFLRRNNAGGYELVVIVSIAVAARVAMLNITYQTS